MNIKNRIIGLLLVLITIFTMISPLTPAYAVGGGDGLGNTTSTGGSSSGTWSSSRTGIRVYVVDKNGNLVSNIVDVISNTAIPNYRIIACLGTRGNGTYQSFAAGGLYANGVFNSSTNSGAKVTIISDTTAGLRGKGMPIQTYTSSKFSTHGETLRKTMLGSSGNTWIDDTEVMGGGGGASSTEGAKEFGEFISELNTALIDTFNKQKELGIYSNAELIAYIDKQIISITNQINGVDSETGEALFTDEEKQVIAATLQKFKETALSELNTGTENSSEESLSVDVTNQLFDIAYASETSGNSLHQLYDDGELIRFMDKFIGSIPLFYFNEASGVTQLSVYSETGQESFLLTCAEKGFIIFMEPLFYSRLNKANKAASEYLFYGTVSNYGRFISDQAASGGWTNGNDVGGNLDRALHQSLTWSMYTEFDLNTSEEGGSLNIQHGAANGKLNQKLTNSELAQSMQYGFGLHYYRFKSEPQGPGIPTYDVTLIDPNPTPHKAQDPDPYTGKIPLTPGENPEPTTPDGKGYQQTTRRYNIIKEYSIKKLDGTIEHVSTHWSGFNPGIVYVQHEPDYKVVEWYQSANYENGVTPISTETTWEELKATVTPTAGTDIIFDWDSVSEGQAGETVGTSDLGDNCKHYDEATQQPSDGLHYNDTTVVLRLMLAEIPIETHTFDQDPDVTPGSAPDPRDPDEGGPLTPQEEEQLKFTIVKVYETMDEEGNISVDGVFTREETAGIVEVETENPPKNPGYELIEWHYSTDDVRPVNNWDDALSASPILGSGRSPGKVDIRNQADIYEERTLYVLLRREISEEMVPGDIIIQQSQISKAIHTDDPNIGPRWGNYEFVASIGTFQLTHTAYYSHGCCGSCDPPCGSCHGHTCKLEMPGRNGDNKLNFVFDQINAEQSLQVKTGVHSDTDPKVYIPNGQHPETIGSMYAADNVYEYVSDGNQKNGAELVTVLWRGGANPTDIPTLAKYKQTDIQNRYGSANWQIPQAMLKNASNTSHKTRATGPSVNSLSITFGIDQNASDLYGTASCVTHNGYNCIYRDTRRVYMIAGTEFDYDFDAQVGVQFYAGAPKGLAAQPFGGPASTVMKQEDTSGPHYENTIIQGKQQIKFYPYIKMTYMTNSLKLAELEEANTDTYVNKTRYETYVLSEWESSILPSDAVEVGWKNNNEGESLMLTSQQWSLHQKAVNGGQAWNGANQVLPGGAIYQLSTPSNNLTTVDLVTYQTVVDQKTRQYLSSTLSGDEYTEAKVAKDHTDFVNDVKETIDNLRIVQWVRALSEREWKNLQGKPASSIPNAWPVDWAENPGDGSICVRGGGESLNELGLPGVTSSETKYYMHKAAELLDYQSAELKDITKDLMSGSQETASEGDLDIISLSNTTTVFKVFTDTAGNVYIASVSATGTDNEQIITDLVSQLRDVNADTVATGAAGVDAVRLADRTTSGEEINSVLSGDAKQIDDRTKFITNIVSSLTRNRGTDKTAAWATNDGNWYNEAFDGIYLVRQATKLQVGLLYSNIRTSALDPALCPTNTGTSNLYATAHISQFCLNDKSDATIAADKDERYIGTFKDTDIVLPDMEGMYQSRKFYIPNANVQDLY